MSGSEFSFGDQAVAAGYDAVLVPMLFEPWAEQLVAEFGPWDGRSVLDLAAGTGVLTRRLADEVGPSGRVIAADINREMLQLARQRCAGARSTVEFVESPAHPLDVADGSVDAVMCQQGFQFFPDKPAAAREIQRVLRPGGRVVVTTWCDVEQCEFFGGICRALEAIGQPEIAAMMRAPFDFMPAAELCASFEGAGFSRTRLGQQERPLTIVDGHDPVRVAYATPIGPALRALSDDEQARFRAALADQVGGAADERSLGRMVSNVLVAETAA